MRSIWPAIVACFFLTLNGSALRAQTNDATNTSPPDPQIEREKKMISFLTPEQQQQYARARAKALGDNPQLKADGDALLAQGTTVMAGGSPADRQAFIEKMNSHRQMLRQAMLKEDGTLGPIFTEIDKHISELKAKLSSPTSDATVSGSPPPH